MTFKLDIIARIENDFNDNSIKALDILENAIRKTEYLKNDRIIRCIIFLSKGDLNELKKFIEIAIFDPRDVIASAEYEKNSDFENFKRLRNFNNSFEENNDGLKE